MHKVSLRTAFTLSLNTLERGSQPQQPYTLESLAGVECKPCDICTFTDSA